MVLLIQEKVILFSVLSDLHTVTGTETGDICNIGGRLLWPEFRHSCVVNCLKIVWSKIAGKIVVSRNNTVFCNTVHTAIY